jgi:hypothetical protein
MSSDDQDRPADAATTPRRDEDVPPRNAEGRGAQRPRSDRPSGPERGEDPAAGTVDHPIAPGEAQAGDLSEMGANLGGPVDVFPLRDRARKERPPV